MYKLERCLQRLATYAVAEQVIFDQHASEFQVFEALLFGYSATSTIKAVCESLIAFQNPYHSRNELCQREDVLLRQAARH
jgi:hypothetical protein